MPNSLVGQRFNVDDRVIRKNSSVLRNRFKLKEGSVIETLTKVNKVGTKQYYYKVLWDDKRSSEHAQHSLQPIKES